MPLRSPSTYHALPAFAALPSRLHLLRFPSTFSFYFFILFLSCSVSASAQPSSALPRRPRRLCSLSYSLSLCLFIFFLATSPALVINTGNSPVIIFLLSFLLLGYSAVTRYLHCLVSQASVHLSHSLAQLDQLPSIHANNRKPTGQICPSAHSLVLVALLIPPRLNQRTTYARRQPWIQPSEYLSSGICGSPNLLEHR